MPQKFKLTYYFIDLVCGNNILYCSILHVFVSRYLPFESFLSNIAAQ